MKLEVPANGATEICPFAMKTRSATKALRVEEEEEAVEPLPLDKLAPEVLNIIAEALAAAEDILIPRHLGSLARSCKVIKEAVRDAKDKLKVEYNAARALVVKCRRSIMRRGRWLSSAARRSRGLWRGGLQCSSGTTNV